MGKIFGILMIVIGIWVGLTVFREGTDAAFGGLFADAKKETADTAGRPVTRRVEESVGRAYQTHEQRTESGAAE
jgi:hypothetical protein